MLSDLVTLIVDSRDALISAMDYLTDWSSFLMGPPLDLASVFELTAEAESTVISS